MHTERMPTANSTRRKRPPGDRAATTPERIVACAIKLFNRKGLRNVPVEEIAATLKISPGNLTYHFKKKHDLIAATLAILQDRMTAALERPTSVKTPRDGVNYLLRLYRTLWDFRFFFNALTYVLTIPQLREDYLRFRESALTSMERDLEALREQKMFLRMTPPNTDRLLAENMWSLWLNWLRSQQLRTPAATRPDDIALYDCALHNWSLCQPVMDPDYARALLEELRRALPLHARERATPKTLRAAT